MSAEDAILGLVPKITAAQLRAVLLEINQVTSLRNTGTAASDGAYNASKLNDLIASGVSSINIPADTFPCGRLLVEGRTVEISSARGMGGSGSRRARLLATAGMTDHFIRVEGANSGLRLTGMDIHGNRDAQSSAFDLIYAGALDVASRSSIVIDNSAIRYSRGNLVTLGARRHSWIIKNHSFFLVADGYGVKSVGCEDIYFENSEAGETGKTAIHIDGTPEALVGNIRLSNFDVYRGGMLDPGGAVALGDYDNIHIGQYATTTKLMFGELLGAYRHGISYARGTSSDDYAAHFQHGIRFTSNSRRSNGTYSDVYTEVGALSAVGNTHSPFGMNPGSQVKNLYETAASVPAGKKVVVVAPQWAAPRDGYAGSFSAGGAFTNDLGKISLTPTP